MARSLLVRNPNGTTTEFHLDKPTIKIGRATDNDLVLLDPDRSVSRWHAAIDNPERGMATIVDLKSSNGTMVNGRVINLHVELKPQDVIQIGQFQLTLMELTDSGRMPVPDDSRFQIKSGGVRMEDLQREPTYLPPGRGESGRNNLELMYEVGIKLARCQTIQQVTNESIELVFRISEVHRAAVILWDAAKNEFGPMTIQNRAGGGGGGSLPDSYDPENVVMSQSILNRVRQENVPLLIRDAKAEAMFDSDSSIIRAGIQAAFCAPLSCQGEFHGIIYADNLAEADAFSDEDFRTFSSIASQSGLALANVLSALRLRQTEIERQALRQYLPPQVADMILAAGGASQLRGVLQPVTVLYADIRGFTTMSEQMSAPDIVEMLSEFFTLMSGRILECNGTLDKFIGDCIMALFGAPVESKTASRDAVAAAIKMQKAIAAWNADRQRRGQNPVQIGIGLHCGPAVVGNIGSADRVQYTAIGDTVNVAARLVNQASAGQIIVSGAIYEALADFPGIRPLGTVELKGRSGTMPVFEVTWTDGIASK